MSLLNVSISGVPELPYDSHKEAFLCACCWHYSKDKDCECNPKAPSFPVCFPSHQQPNFFPPLWRQQQRRLTSGTMEQLLISINGLRVARGFMRLRAFFFIPFIWIEWNFPSHRFMTGTLKMNLKKKKKKFNNTTIFFVKRVYWGKKLSSVTKHFKCNDSDFFFFSYRVKLIITIILLNT